MPSFEVLLPLGALAFYLYDCIMPLHGNEVLFLHERARRWRVATGSPQMLLRRYWAAPACLQPWVAVQRAWWSDEPRATANASAHATGATAPPPMPLPSLALRITCTALLLLLVMALPAVAAVYGAGLVMLAVFAAYYALVLLALYFVYRQRQLLGIRGRQMALLALDVLACAPFAVNLVRRLSLPVPLPGDAVALGSSLLAAPERAQLRERLLARIDDSLAAEAEDLERCGRLQTRRAEIEGVLR